MYLDIKKYIFIRDYVVLYLLREGKRMILKNDKTKNALSYWGLGSSEVTCIVWNNYNHFQFLGLASYFFEKQQ